MLFLGIKKFLFSRVGVKIVSSRIDKKNDETLKKALNECKN